MTNKPFGELSDAEKGALLLAHHEGRRVLYLNVYGKWQVKEKRHPILDHDVHRIAPEPLVPDSIDWSHVAPKWQFMVRCESGRVFLFATHPQINATGWLEYYSDMESASVFASYRRGTVDWKDSLVRRPEATS